MADFNDDGIMDAVQRRLMFEDELRFSFPFFSLTLILLRNPYCTKYLYFINSR